jgi:NAD-dependent DNA ligase
VAEDGGSALTARRTRLRIAQSLPPSLRLSANEDFTIWAIGVKFTARSAATRLERIDVQVERTGMLTPIRTRPAAR